MKILAFYLPQYHQIPENDAWWGKGFTEWINVKKSKPVFKGHYQPRVPLHHNYYDLSDENVMVQQMNLAKEYGIYGFCFYHYWFGGKKLLEKPIENILKNNKTNLPYCFSWANEPWTRTWDGRLGSKQILIAQNYGSKEDWKKHFDYLLPFFQDPHYIQYNNKPVFLIYRAQNVTNLTSMMNYWQKWAKDNGLNGISFFQMNTSFGYLRNASEFDAIVDFEPMRTIQKAKSLQTFLVKFKTWQPWTCNISPNKVKYSDICNEIIKDEEILESKRLYGMFTGFDNSPRRGKKGIIICKNSPDLFEHYLRIQTQRSVYAGNEFLFINAWNEWGEGAYLEPDEKYKYAYLNAIKNVLNSIK